MYILKVLPGFRGVANFPTDIHTGYSMCAYLLEHLTFTFLVGSGQYTWTGTCFSLSLSFK